MGGVNSRQSPSRDVFSKELTNINSIINDILHENNTFKNESYNFLSDDVCNKYQVVLESDLSKHLKLELAEYGTLLYVIPKEDIPSTNSKIKITKAEICERISSHYIRILYILSLIKHVYNLENNGDRSFAGIINRNIKIVNNLMEVQYCGIDQGMITSSSSNKTVDLGKLEGFDFFLKIILTDTESREFMKLMRAILGRYAQHNIHAIICQAKQKNTITQMEFDILSSLFKQTHNKDLICSTKVSHNNSTRTKDKKTTKINSHVNVKKMNPVFLQEYCPIIENVVVDLSTEEGKHVKQIYELMRNKVQQNIRKVNDILTDIVFKNKNGTYELKDVDSNTLDAIVNKTKICIRLFYLESILYYQHLLNVVKNIATLKVSIDRNGFM